MACGVMATARRVGGGAVASSARTQNQKRGRDGKVVGVREGVAAGEAPVVPALGQRRLQERMKAELDAVRALHRKAMLLCRGGAGTTSGGAGAAPAAKGARLSGAEPRRGAAAAKRRKANPSEESATEAAAQQKKGQLKQQQAPAPRLAPPPSAKKDAEKKRRMEETAREREKWRRLVLAMEMAVLPDETVYRHELEELGVTPFEYAVTRTRNQALSQHRMLVGAAA